MHIIIVIKKLPEFLNGFLFRYFPRSFVFKKILYPNQIPLKTFIPQQKFWEIFHISSKSLPPQYQSYLMTAP